MLLVVNRKMADEILYFPPQQRGSQLEKGNNWKFLFIYHASKKLHFLDIVIFTTFFIFLFNIFYCRIYAKVYKFIYFNFCYHVP